MVSAPSGRNSLEPGLPWRHRATRATDGRSTTPCAGRISSPASSRRRRGQPRRTYLVGHSLGALAIVKLAEQYPGQDDGVLAMCGPLGGALAELEYAGNARVTFDHDFPGVLPGHALRRATRHGVPLALRPGRALGAVPPGVRRAQRQSAGDVSVGRRRATPVRQPGRLGNSALYVIGFLPRYTNDLVARVNGATPFDNQDVHYQVNVTQRPATNAFLSGLLNDGVERFTADPRRSTSTNATTRPTAGWRFR